MGKGKADGARKKSKASKRHAGGSHSGGPSQAGHSNNHHANSGPQVDEDYDWSTKAFSGSTNATYTSDPVREAMLRQEAGNRWQQSQQPIPIPEAQGNGSYNAVQYANQVLPGTQNPAFSTPYAQQLDINDDKKDSSSYSGRT